MARHFWFVLALVLLPLLSLGRVCQCDFINFDDPFYVTENPHVLNGLDGWDIAWAFRTMQEDHWHPLTWLSLQLDATLFGPKEAWGFHLHNLLLHLANVLLLYAVLFLMTKKPWPSFWVAALFAVHPLHVESVAWVTERKDVLSTFFWLLGLLAYARYALKPHWQGMALVAGLMILGLMAKAMVVTFPCTLLLLDIWPLRRWPLRAATPEGDLPSFAPAGALGLIVEKLPLFLIGLAAGALTFGAHHKDALIDVSKPSDNLPRAVISYGWYLYKTIVPTNLGVFYIDKFLDWSWLWLGISGLALLAITVASVMLARRHRYLLVGWLWFLGTLVPVIGFIQLAETAHCDRYAYVPHIGLFIAVVWSLAALVRRVHVPVAVARMAACAAVLTLAGITFVQAGYWQDSGTLWTHTAAVTRDNHRALWHLGDWYETNKDKDVEQAVFCYQEAYRLRPDIYSLLLALKLEGLGRIDEAIVYYRLAAKSEQYLTAPETAPALFGFLLLKRGQAVEAEEMLRLAIKRQRFKDQRENSPDMKLLGHCLGVALIRQGKWQEAITILKEGSDPVYWAYAIYQSGETQEAERLYARLTSANPRWPQDGVAEARKLVANDPQTALEMIAAACQATKFSDPELLDALAVAQAATGDFTAAQKTATDALALAKINSELAERIENHLRQYQNHKATPEPDTSNP